jgi:hypothetical protein
MGLVCNPARRIVPHPDLKRRDGSKSYPAFRKLNATPLFSVPLLTSLEEIIRSARSKEWAHNPALPDTFLVTIFYLEGVSETEIGLDEAVRSPFSTS